MGIAMGRIAGLLASTTLLVLTGAPAALATALPPDPVESGPPRIAPLVADPSIGQQIHWMLAGASIALAIVAAVVALSAVLSRRQRARARRLRLI
jgi:hypothetical protein